MSYVKLLKKEISILEKAIEDKLKSGDLRGLNSIQKRLTRLKRKLRRYK